MFSSKLAIGAIIVYAISQLVMIACLLFLQLDGIKQRAIIRSQNDFLVCILKVEPVNRTSQVIETCKAQTEVK